MSRVVTVEELKTVSMDLMLHARLQGGSLYAYKCREHPMFTMSQTLHKRERRTSTVYVVDGREIEGGEGRGQRIADALTAYYAKKETENGPLIVAEKSGED